jgi:hypothetical protein
MSRQLLDAKGDYLHSPLDDLEAFFWVALWSLLFNKKSGGGWEVEKDVKEALLDNEKESAIRRFLVINTNRECNDATKRFKTVLKDWWKVVRDRNSEWIEEFQRHPEDAILPHFHRLALTGVLDVLRVLQKHWDGEISWESWTSPT